MEDTNGVPGRSPSRRSAHRFQRRASKDSGVGSSSTLPSNVQASPAGMSQDLPSPHQDFSGGSTAGATLAPTLPGRDPSVSGALGQGSVATSAQQPEPSGILSTAVHPPTESGNMMDTHMSLNNMNTTYSLGYLPEGHMNDHSAGYSAETRDDSAPYMHQHHHSVDNPTTSAESPRTGNEKDHPTSSSRYTRRWESAPNTRRILDDSALEADPTTPSPQKDKDKERVREIPGLKKGHSKSLHAGDKASQHPISSALLQTASPHMALKLQNENSNAKNSSSGRMSIQLAAKQTGFLQRHISAKAERNKISSGRIDSLRQLDPRRDHKTDPNERILAWIEQGELYFQSMYLPKAEELFEQPASQVPMLPGKRSSHSRSTRKRKSTKKVSSPMARWFSCFRSC